MSSLSGAVQLYDTVLHNSCGDVGCKAPAPYANLLSVLMCMLYRLMILVDGHFMLVYDLLILSYESCLMCLVLFCGLLILMFCMLHLF